MGAGGRRDWPALEGAAARGGDGGPAIPRGGQYLKHRPPLGAYASSDRACAVQIGASRESLLFIFLIRHMTDFASDGSSQRPGPRTPATPSVLLAGVPPPARPAPLSGASRCCTSTMPTRYPDSRKGTGVRRMQGHTAGRRRAGADHRCMARSLRRLCRNHPPRRKANNGRGARCLLLASKDGDLP